MSAHDVIAPPLFTIGLAPGNPVTLIASVACVSLMEGGCTIREAALKIALWFNVSSATDASPPAREATRTDNQQLTAEKQEGSETPASNLPLDFTLKGVDPHHRYLEERGLTLETAATFGVGFFGGKGSMSGRVVIPIHNREGKLVAYAGRWVGPDDSLPEGEEKYKLPKGFQKSLELFNLHRVRHCRHLVVVEGYFGAIRLHGLRVPTIALMGSALFAAGAWRFRRQFQ